MGYTVDKGDPGGIPALIWSTDSTTVVGTSGATIRAWGVADGTPVAVIARSTDNRQATPLGWAAGRLVEAETRTIVTWDLGTGTTAATIEVPVLTALWRWPASADAR